MKRKRIHEKLKREKNTKRGKRERRKKHNKKERKMRLTKICAVMALTICELTSTIGGNAFVVGAADFTVRTLQLRMQR